MIPKFIIPFKPRNDDELDKTVLKHTKKHKNVIHGRKSLNTQMPKPFHRQTSDWDIFSKTPKAHMESLDDRLDEAVGYDAFKEATIQLMDSNQTVYRVVSRRTGEEVADFMLTPPGLKYKLISGVRYETLEHAKMVYRRILANPRLRDRWVKSRGDLNDIIAFERQLKNGEKKTSHTISDVRIPREFKMVMYKSIWR